MPNLAEQQPTMVQDSPDGEMQAKLVFFGNEFPSDDLKDLFRRLHQLSKDRRFRTLATFQDEATRVLQHEIAKLPQPIKDEVGHFDNLLALAEHGDFRPGALGAAMESALLTALQLCMLIGYVTLNSHCYHAAHSSAGTMRPMTPSSISSNAAQLSPV